MAGRRTTPPSGIEGELARPRLDAILDGRWHHRLTVVRAGPGFGKTTLAAQAVRRNHARPTGVDVWLGCTPSDADGSRLLDGLSAALGVDTDLGATADERFLTVSDAVATRSPTNVSLVLDDAHHLVPGSGGAEVLDRLVRDGPENLRALLVTRDDPVVGTTRLRAAGDLLELDEQQLALDDAEVTALGVDPEAGRELGGWPALVRLSALLGRPATQQYLVEEVLASLDAPSRRALAVSAVLGGVDRTLLGEITGDDGDPVALVGHLPMVAVHADVVVAHDLWGGDVPGLAAALDGVDDDGWRRGISILRRRGDHERALALALRVGVVDEALAVVHDGTAERLPVFPADTATRWLEALPPDVRTRPEAVLLAAAARIDDAETRLDRLGILHDELAAAGCDAERLSTLAVRANLAYGAGDIGTVLAIRGQLAELDEAPAGLLGAIAAGVDAVLADLGGVPEQVVTLLGDIDLDQLPDDLRLQLTRLLANGLVLSGRAQEALDRAGPVLSRAADPHVRRTVTALRHLAGDHLALRALADPGAADVELASHDAVFHEAFAAHLGAALGVAKPLPASAWSLAEGNDRLRVLLATARAVGTITAGADEAEVAAALRDDLTGWEGSPLAAAELRRFPAVTEVLLPGAIQRHEGLGPSVVDALAAADLLSAARNGSGLSGAVPDPGRIITALPLRWSTELAARAAADGAPWSADLAASLADLAGEAVSTLLETHAVSDDPALANGATTLLATVPMRPAASVRIELLGPLTVRRGNGAVDDPLLRRQRVRQLIALLALDGPVNRWRLLDLLWPEADQDKALRNLRTNLSHVRRVFEPGLTGRRASYFLRTTGDRLRLGGAGLSVDLWELRDHLADAVAAEDDHRLDDAVVSYRSAVELWRGEPFVDLADVDDTAARSAELTAQVLVAATRAAELLLARGEHAQASTLAARAIEIDGFHEPAHRIAIAAAAHRGDRSAVELAVARLRAMLGELGVEPAPETAMALELAEGFCR